MTTAELIARLRGLMVAAKAARSFNVSSVKIHTDFLSELEDAAPALLAAAERHHEAMEAWRDVQACLGVHTQIEGDVAARAWNRLCAALAQEDA